jgi:hypothetical protein
VGWWMACDTIVGKDFKIDKINQSDFCGFFFIKLVKTDSFFIKIESNYFNKNDFISFFIY